MTQTARKGKLYQLQFLIDLSSFIISHILVFGCSTPCGATKLIYFAHSSHKLDGPAGIHRFAKRRPSPIGEGLGESSYLPPNGMIENADVMSLFRVSYFGKLANQTGSH